MHKIIMHAIVYGATLASCANATNSKQNFKGKEMLTEQAVLGELGLAYQHLPGSFFPNTAGGTSFNLFLDLENGYLANAGSRIHLFADSFHWALVFETCDYAEKLQQALVDLYYFGNAVDYSVLDPTSVGNWRSIPLISSSEFDRLESLDPDEMFHIDKAENNVEVRGSMVSYNNDFDSFRNRFGEKAALDPDQQAFGFHDFVRHLYDTQPTQMQATEKEIRKPFTRDIPKLMTIDRFHYISSYDNNVMPSAQETYRLIAKILVSKDTAQWAPSQKANNHWTNWESGHL